MADNKQNRNKIKRDMPFIKKAFPVNYRKYRNIDYTYRSFSFGGSAVTGTLKENKDAVTKKSGDEGIDGIVSADKFGFDSIYIQAKQWKPDTAVGRPEIQKFMGDLAGQGATKGILITTAKFTKEAIDYASKQLNIKIILVDGDQLAKLMIEYDLGVSTVSMYTVKRIDSDFFNEDV